MGLLDKSWKPRPEFGPYADDMEAAMKNFAYPVAHPIDTLSGIGGLLSGGLSKAGILNDPQAEQMLSGAGDYFSRYSPSNIGDTLTHHPFTSAVDLIPAAGGLYSLSKLGENAAIRASSAARRFPEYEMGNYHHPSELTWEDGKRVVRSSSIPEVSRVDIPNPNNLPMDDISRLQRAREGGWDTDKTWYHGTVADTPIEEFKPASRHGVEYEGISLSEKPAYSANYADPETGYTRADTIGHKRIYPLYVKPENIYDPRRPEHRVIREDILKELGPGYRNPASQLEDFSPMEEASLYTHGVPHWNDTDMIKAIRKRGFSGYVNMEEGSNAHNLRIFDPSIIRHTKAVYDPSKVGSRNIYAGIAGASAVPFGLRAYQRGNQ